jgi:hypothetical protein
VPIFQTLMGMSLSQAKNTFRDLCKQAIHEAEAEATLNLPPNLGDLLLEKEAGDPKTGLMLDKRRKEGVRNQDIKWWMNRHELDRKMMMKVDDMSKLALFIKLKEENGCTEAEAAMRVKKFFPIYGDPEDTSTSTGDDRPLPFELKDRINIYIEKVSRSDPNRYKREVEKASSFNALIRKEIKNGKI